MAIFEQRCRKISKIGSRVNRNMLRETQVAAGKIRIGGMSRFLDSATGDKRVRRRDSVKRNTKHRGVKMLRANRGKNKTGKGKEPEALKCQARSACLIGDEGTGIGRGIGRGEERNKGVLQ
jgi:hypothetical protein